MNNDPDSLTHEMAAKTVTQQDAYAAEVLRWETTKRLAEQIRQMDREIDTKVAIRQRLAARNLKARRFPLSRKGRIARPRVGELPAVNIRLPHELRSDFGPGFAVDLSPLFDAPGRAGGMWCDEVMVGINIESLIRQGKLGKGARLTVQEHITGGRVFYVTIPSRPARMSKKLQAYFDRL